MDDITCTRERAREVICAVENSEGLRDAAYGVGFTRLVFLLPVQHFLCSQFPRGIRDLGQSSTELARRRLADQMIPKTEVFWSCVDRHEKILSC
jgi:hypothetical protein